MKSTNTRSYVLGDNGHFFFFFFPITNLQEGIWYEKERKKKQKTWRGLTERNNGASNSKLDGKGVRNERREKNLYKRMHCICICICMHCLCLSLCYYYYYSYSISCCLPPSFPHTDTLCVCVCERGNSNFELFPS